MDSGRSDIPCVPDLVCALISVSEFSGQAHNWWLGERGVGVCRRGNMNEWDPLQIGSEKPKKKET